MSKKVDANNIMAIGGAIMGISAAVFILCMIMFYSPFVYWDYSLAIILLILFCMFAFFVGNVILIIGVIFKVIQSSGSNQNTTVNAQTINTSVKKTESTVVYEKKPEDLEGLVKCPHCGKEQKKNPFGCIYCHEKL